MATRKLPAGGQTAFLRRLAMNPDTELMFTQRSGHKAEALGIERPDFLSAILTGRVTHSDHLGPDWRRTVHGRDRDGETIALVVTVVPIGDGRNKRIVVLDCEREQTEEDFAAS
jgi:hypothetical protein